MLDLELSRRRYYTAANVATLLFSASRGPGNALVRRLGPRIGLTTERLDRAGRFIERRGRVALVIGRGTPGLRTVTAVAAGTSGLSVRRALPALLRAYQIGSRVAAVGFDWVAAGDVIDKIEEEIAELRRAVQTEGRGRSEEELGDLLFSIANLSRKLGLEPEAALRRANEKFTARFEALERRFEARGASVHGASLEELEAEWTRVKETHEPGADTTHSWGTEHGIWERW